jgi:predicted transposase YdaD
MPGRWDTSTKRLVGENPEHFIKWLLPGAEIKEKAQSKPLNLNTREREVDALYEILLYGTLCLVHIEFQSFFDGSMAQRMWEYNTLATFSYNRPTCSFVIYLKKCEVPESLYEWTFPNGEVIHHFHFKVIKLWEISAKMLKQTGLPGIFPLMVLTKDGKRREVVDEVITSLQQQGGESAKELISLTYIFATLAFENQGDLTWLKRRINQMQDFLQESWLYQEIMQEGFDKGIEKEREEELRRQRQLLMTIIHMHFPNITSLSQKQADAIKDPEVLQSLIFKILAAETEEEATQCLIAVSQQ